MAINSFSKATPILSTRTPFTNLPKARASVPRARMELMLELSCRWLCAQGSAFWDFLPWAP